MSSSTSRSAQAFQVTLDLHEAGVAIMRQNLRRAHADASEAEIDEYLRRWLRDRPGAEHGDCPGRPVPPGERGL